MPESRGAYSMEWHLVFEKGAPSCFSRSICRAFLSEHDLALCELARAGLLVSDSRSI